MTDDTKLILHIYKSPRLANREFFAEGVREYTDDDYDDYDDYDDDDRTYTGAYPGVISAILDPDPQNSGMYWFAASDIDFLIEYLFETTHGTIDEDFDEETKLREYGTMRRHPLKGLLPLDDDDNVEVTDQNIRALGLLPDNAETLNDYVWILPGHGVAFVHPGMNGDGIR